MATIIIKGDGVLIRGVAWSRRIPIAKIQSVDPVDARNMYGIPGKTLVIRTVDGRKVVAGEFWAPIDRTGHAARIDAIVQELNRLKALQAAAGQQKAE